MNMQDIIQEISEIKACIPDDQSAHEGEKALYRHFIEHVATGNDSLAKMARRILTTDKINFCRWFA